MKLIAAICLCLIPLSASVVTADQVRGWYIEEYIETAAPTDMPTRNGIVKSWFADGKLRKDSFGQEILIFRPDAKETILVHPPSRTYSILPIEHIKRMTEQSLSAYQPLLNDPTKKPEDLYRKTGRREKIGAWDSWEIKLMVKAVTAPGVTSQTTWWITDEAGVGPELLINIYRASMGETKSSNINKLYDAIASLKGYPVRQVTETDVQGQKIVTTMTVLKVEKQKIDASLFTTPADYKKTDMPSMISPGKFR